MKRLLLFMFIGVVSGSLLYAQTPQNKKRVMIFDFSDTWCAPCGQFGVAIADTVNKNLENGDLGYLVGIKGSFHPSTPASINAMGADVLFDNFDLLGVPSFVVGNYLAQAPTGNNTGDIAGIMTAVNSFNARRVIASPAANIVISGNMLTVNAKAKFWDTASGEYYMTAFLTEDSIIADQAMNSPTTEHRHVLKGTMATSGTGLVAAPWGERIGSSFINANTEFSKTYKVSIDPAWRRDKLEAYVLIFKKEDTTYQYINAGKAEPPTTAVNNVTSTIEDVALYPNPTKNNASLDLALKSRAGIRINVTDAIGRSVYTASYQLPAGRSTVIIPSNNFSNGQYDVVITHEGTGHISRKLTVAR